MATKHLGVLTLTKLRQVGGLIDPAQTKGAGRPKLRSIGDIFSSEGGQVALQVFEEKLRSGKSQAHAERTVAKRLNKTVQAVKQSVKRYPSLKIEAEIRHRFKRQLSNLKELELYLLAMPIDLKLWAEQLPAMPLLDFLRASGASPGTCPPHLESVLRAAMSTK